MIRGATGILPVQKPGAMLARRSAEHEEGQACDTQDRLALRVLLLLRSQEHGTHRLFLASPTLLCSPFSRERPLPQRPLAFHT